MTATTALYRRYRPDSFADVIGQEHVTEPLMTALRKNRVNHAYLFSGPRGCGKTTSARILARCLNCAKGPTDTPCGSCPSCVELARGGSGSLDVIEIDAASHGGVDDARDLRERATFAPVRDRYKIFIIDEAHMVTSAGFNALLKIVEEPPEHIKFIFATTEPDKVIGTIRSRTHHYPFRLVPPEPLLAYLELLCRQENVAVAPGVLSLVIRAGGGSVRDTLSVLDQLMAGAGAGGLDYELAVALLGYTHATLLDDVVDAIAASDSATVFKAVDRVIQTGHDPRRFVEDLLERFRDLIIVRAMPESASAILRGMPADQIARLHQQAHNLGASELSRAADVTNTALTEMTGATSPRLHLELLCARILLPSAEQTERGIAARIDRVERRLNYAGNDVASPAPVAAPAEGRPDVGPAAPANTAPAATVPSAPAAAASVPAPVPTPGAPAASASAPVPAPAAPAASASAPVSAAEPAEPAVSAGTDREQITPPRVSTSDWPRDDVPQAAPASSPAPAHLDRAAYQKAPPTTPGSGAPAAPPAPAAPSAAVPAAPPAETQPARPQPSSPPVAQPAVAGHGDVEVLRRAWPDVLQTLTKIKRSTWALVEPNAKVASFDGQLLTLAFTTSGLAGAFGRADHSENLRQAIHKTVGIECQIQAVAGGSGAASSEPNPKAPTTPDVPPTSVDEAWGLISPSSATAPAAASAPEASDTPIASTAPAQPAATPPPVAPSVAPAPVERAAPLPPAAPTVTAQPHRTSEAGTASLSASAQPPAAGSGSDSGTSGYSDDDWGPPLDEDAPPLEEEPPMDWMPPNPSRSAAGAQATPLLDSATSDSEGTTAGTKEPNDDPWSRAVEQAPGVWQVGAVSNITKVQELPGPSARPAGSPPIGGEVEIGSTGLRAQSSSAPAARPDNAGWGSPEPQPETTEPPRPEPVYAMAAAAPAPAVPAPARATEPAPAPAPAPAPPGRQSLYQRLSNSPEAQAGRARVAQAAAAAVTPYVQDIPDPEDETIEESGVFGRAAVERILGGKLIDERSLDGSPLPPRF